MGTRVNDGEIAYDDGTARPARFYTDDEEAVPDLPAEHCDTRTHTMWTERDGTIGICRNSAVSVGATRKYAAKYDEIDWGN